MTQQQQLAEAVRALFERRNLTLNAVSQRFGLDRNAVTRMANGVPASLEFTERFARTFGEDVNHWRVLSGYPAVEQPYDAPTFERQLCEELSVHYQEPAFAVTHLRNGSDLAPDTLRAVVIRRVELIEQRLRERFREQGRELPPPLFVTDE